METTSDRSLILTGSGLHPYRANLDCVNRYNLALFHVLFDCPVALLGSCNGLLCFAAEDGSIVLWNPSTKNFKKLPDEKIEPPRTVCQLMDGFYGFGYDSVNDDYKVLRIMQFRGTWDKEFKVYSLKSDSWKRVRGFLNTIDSDTGVLANNALHWVVKVMEHICSKSFSVISFDLGTEVFRLVPLPCFCERHIHLDLGVLKDCLCVVAKYDINKGADVLIRKKNGAVYYWTKLVKIIMPDLAPDEPVPSMRPITYSSCGKRVLFKKDLNLLVWYDLEKRSATNIPVVFADGNDLNAFELDSYVHSLVQPNSGNPSKKRKSDDSRERGSS